MNDSAKIAALYAPDATQLVPGYVESKGREAIQKGYQDWLDTMTNGQSANVRTWTKGNQAAVEWVTTGTDKATGKPWGIDGLSIYTFNDDGLITKDHTYFDMLTVMKQTGAFKDKYPARGVSTLPSGPVEAHVAKGDANEDKNVASEQAILASWSKLDAKGILGFYTPDAVTDDQSDDKPHNFDETKKEYTSFLKSKKDGKWTDWADFGVEDVTVDDGEFTFTEGKKPLTMHVAEIDQWKDGKIVHAWLWMNGVEVAKQRGIGPFAKTAAKAPAAKKDVTSKPPTK
jgi:ketosteroid isomerase-like protein